MEKVKDEIPVPPRGAILFGANNEYCLKWDWDELDTQDDENLPGIYQLVQVEKRTKNHPAFYVWKWVSSRWRVIGYGRDEKDNVWYQFEIKDEYGTQEASLIGGFWERRGGWRPLLYHGVWISACFDKLDRWKLFFAMMESKNPEIFNWRDMKFRSRRSRGRGYNHRIEN